MKKQLIVAMIASFPAKRMASPDEIAVADGGVIAAMHAGLLPTL